MSSGAGAAHVRSVSKNRENIVWQSADGTWNRGFFSFYSTGDTSDPDYDDEWDVEYDTSTFHWVSVGHATEDGAWRSWTGANPGGGSVLSFEPDRADDVERYEDMAAVVYEQEQARRKADPAYGRWASRADFFGDGHGPFVGPARPRSLAGLQREINRHRREHWGHRVGGYDNMLHPDAQPGGPLEKRVAETLAAASAQEREGYEERQAAYRQSLRDLHTKTTTSMDEDARRSARYGGYGGWGYSGGQSPTQKRRQALLELVEAIEQMEANAAARRARIEAAKTPSPTPPAAAPPRTTGRTTAHTTARAKAGVQGAAATTRRKSTPKSTPGSFASRQRDEPSVAVGDDLNRIETDSRDTVACPGCSAATDATALFENAGTCGRC